MLKISVIIPTYNRFTFLLQALQAFAGQTYPNEKFEVIIVDDGSQDETSRIQEAEFPYKHHYIWQQNAGDAAARNTGVRQAQGALIVFVDDDVLVGREYLRALAQAHQQRERKIVAGTEILWLDVDELPDLSASATPDEQLHSIDFVNLCSNNMSILREHFLALGMMQGLDFPGSSIWCDTDFAYRAHLAGFQFLRSERAQCWHRDYTALSLQSRVDRANKVAYRSVALFKRHPDLVHYLPMFSDMTPINRQEDSFIKMVRKIMRRFSATEPALWALYRLNLAAGGSDHYELTGEAKKIEKWLIGGNIYRSFRKGLSEAKT